MATHATLWLDMRDQFADKHHAEWEAQKTLAHSLNDLEHNTEVVYRECLTKRQQDKAAANSMEAITKELPPERQVACERKAGSSYTHESGHSPCDLTDCSLP